MKIFKTILSGVVDAIPVVSTIKANVRSQKGGVGNIHWEKLIYSILTLGLIGFVVWLFAKGTITLKEAEELIKLIS